MSDALEITIQGEHVKLKPEILDKYNVHGPRYTSYPTAPEWSDAFGPGDLKQAFERTESRPEKPPVSTRPNLPTTPPIRPPPPTRNRAAPNPAASN